MCPFCLSLLGCPICVLLYAEPDPPKLDLPADDGPDQAVSTGAPGPRAPAAEPIDTC
jgi:hypothetical protein